MDNKDDHDRIFLFMLIGVACTLFIAIVAEMDDMETELHNAQAQCVLK